MKGMDLKDLQLLRGNCFHLKVTAILTFDRLISKNNCGPSVSPYILWVVCFTMYTVGRLFHHIYCGSSVSPYILWVVCFTIYTVVRLFHHVHCGPSVSPYILWVVCFTIYIVTILSSSLFVSTMQNTVRYLVSTVIEYSS